MSSFQTINAQTAAGKRLVVRADLNAPVNNGSVSDATRIERFAKSIKPLLVAGAKITVLSHFGRPNGQRNMEFTIIPVLSELAIALGQDVKFAKDCIGNDTVAASQMLKDGEILLCENLRFHAGEEANDVAFAKELARLGDIYVNDAFSTAHRAHASTYAIANELPAYAGALMSEEINALTAALENPMHPAIAVVGGAKVSSKIAVLKNLVSKVDTIVVGGGMANTFMLADGYTIGKSLAEPDQVQTVHEIRDLAKKANCRIILPVDVVYAFEFAAHAKSVTANLNECPPEAMILDAGKKSVVAIGEEFTNAKTILWNGPMGAFEMEPFDMATVALARKAAELTRAGSLISIAGGGDTVAALNLAGVADDFTYVSTAGGAFLEWLEGKELPGIAALNMTAEKLKRIN
ncbi:MAG: phosphoglycerate kinase [Rhizobiales bacterium]|nr:phosphoglycerate kinase [Hyphomicrobiales bacterium]